LQLNKIKNLKIPISKNIIKLLSQFVFSKTTGQDLLINLDLIEKNIIIFNIQNIKFFKIITIFSAVVITSIKCSIIEYEFEIGDNKNH